MPLRELRASAAAGARCTGAESYEGLVVRATLVAWPAALGGAGNASLLRQRDGVFVARFKHGRAAFVIATKFGNLRFGAGPPCSSTAVIHEQYAESVARLGCAPDLYYQHRPDLTRDVAEVMVDRSTGAPP